jgi:nitrate reductase gamma subunit
MSAFKSIAVSLVAVLALVLIAFIGVGAVPLRFLFGVIIPYLAFVAFIGGVVHRVWKWSSSAVPFRIPTTSGQQKSLPWIKAENLESPHNMAGVVGRMALEVLLFRSLFRNTKAETRDGPKIVYGSDKLLWLAGLAFHWSFLVIVLRHLRFFAGPSVLGFVGMIEGLDGFFEIGLPTLYLTDAALVAAATFLFLRRVAIPQVRYISLPADYFALFLILGIAITGCLMRYIFRVDVVGAKELAIGLVTFNPAVPDGIGATFYIHLFLVSVLIAYFPQSKLMHMGGVFLSPTRNLANDNRERRHVNPWDYEVKVHTYAEYEDEFREKMKSAGLPVEKE